MAKKPEDRYQTPAEVALALASVFVYRAVRMTGRLRTADERPPWLIVQTTRSISALEYMASVGMRKRWTRRIAWPEKRRNDAGCCPRWRVAHCLLVALAVVVFLALKEPAGKKPPVNEKDLPAVANSPDKKTLRKVDDAWLKQVAALPAEKQVEAVAAKLKELNPGFDGKVTHKIEGGVVTELSFVTDKVTDISPVRALTD